MSSIDSLPSGKYKVRWRANGQQYSKIFSKKVDARSHLTTIDGDLLQGRWIDPRAGTVTVAAFAHEWAASANWRPETRGVERAHHPTPHRGPRFGAKELRKVTRADVTRWVADLSRTHKPSTVKTYYRTLAAIFNEAVRDRKIVESPCRDIKFATDEDAGTALTPLTTEQVRALAKRGATPISGHRPRLGGARPTPGGSLRPDYRPGELPQATGDDRPPACAVKWADTSETGATKNEVLESGSSAGVTCCGRSRPNTSGRRGSERMV